MRIIARVLRYSLFLVVLISSMQLALAITDPSDFMPEYMDLSRIPAEKREVFLVDGLRMHTFGTLDVPPGYFSPFVLEALVQTAPSVNQALSLVLEEKFTLGIAIAAVKRDGMLLEKVPLKLRYPFVCVAAVKQNPLASRFVPVRWKRSDSFKRRVAEAKDSTSVRGGGGTIAG